MYPNVWEVDHGIRNRRRTEVDTYARWEYGAADATWLLASARSARKPGRRPLGANLLGRLRLLRGREGKIPD